MTPLWCRASAHIALGALLLLDHATTTEALVGLLLVCAGVGALESSSQPTQGRDGFCHGADGGAGCGTATREERRS